MGSPAQSNGIRGLAPQPSEDAPKWHVFTEDDFKTSNRQRLTLRFEETLAMSNTTHRNDLHAAETRRKLEEARHSVNKSTVSTAHDMPDYKVSCPRRKSIKYQCKWPSTSLGCLPSLAIVDRRCWPKRDNPCSDLTTGRPYSSLWSSYFSTLCLFCFWLAEYADKFPSEEVAELKFCR